jgi:hypothetical protein
LTEQRCQLQQIGHAQARPSGRRLHERIHLGQARPLHADAAQLARSVVVVEAVLAPGQASIDQRESSSAQRVEGVGDFEELRRIVRIVCS